jgi:hypothetical protein
MNDVQKTGGVAALVLAATFVIGFALYLGLLANSGFESGDPVEAVAFLSDYQSILSVWYLIIYVVFGIALVVLTLALYERLKAGASAMAQAAAAFGLIWAGLVIASGMIAIVGIGAVVELYNDDPAQAGSAWVAIESVQFGIGGGIEIVGALWVLLLGRAGLRTATLPRRLSQVGIVTGSAGALTIIPALELFGAVFGLGLVVWFTWAGILMLRTTPERHVSNEGASIDPRFA